jgi:cell division protease FtsH
MEPQRERSHSEETAREIDEEVKRIVEESIGKTRHILDTRRDALEALARRLIEKEVIDAEELKSIIDAHSRGPVIVPGTDAERKRLVEAADAAQLKTEQAGG